MALVPFCFIFQDLQFVTLFLNELNITFQPRFSSAKSLRNSRRCFYRTHTNDLSAIAALDFISCGKYFNRAPNAYTENTGKQKLFLFLKYGKKEVKIRPVDGDLAQCNGTT